MNSDDLLILLGLIIFISVVAILILFIGSRRNWDRHVAPPELDPNARVPQGGANAQAIPAIVAQELYGLNLQVPRQRLEAASAHMTRLINTEVAKQVEHVRQEMTKTIESKEKEVREIQTQVQTISTHYEKLGKQKTQTESVVRSIAKGVIVLNDEGKVVFLNPEAEQILGARGKDLMGKPIGHMTGEHVISMVDEEGAESSDGGDAQEKENMKDNTAVIETLSGQTKGIISLVPHAAPERRIENYKNEFLANITHELRSPLICIQKSISSIPADKIGAEEKVCLDIALRNAARLEQLVNSILDISKMEAGKMHLQLEIINLHEFMKEVRNNFKPWADQKKIQLVLDMPKEPLMFHADEGRLMQVLTNLVSNALKFTPRGEKIWLTAKFSMDKSSHGVEIGVRDSGPGILEADREKIFKKFAFTSAKSTDGEKGTGLGLTIAKQIVELHKGKIWVESEAGKGSYFAFAIPC